MSQTPPKLQKFSIAKQRRLDLLLDKNSEGAITAKEKAALEKLVAEAQVLMVANGRRLMEFAKGKAAHPPAGAVPVTVWVQPQASER